MKQDPDMYEKMLRSDNENLDILTDSLELHERALEALGKAALPYGMILVDDHGNEISRIEPVVYDSEAMIARIEILKSRINALTASRDELIANQTA